jgi:hypothetical protein
MQGRSRFILYMADCRFGVGSMGSVTEYIQLDSNGVKVILSGFDCWFTVGSDPFDAEALSSVLTYM